jgi:predicted ATPase
MITRFYVDNYKCLVDFTYEPNQLELIVGSNGSGKSTVFEALRKLREFITGDFKAEELFAKDDLTRWQKRTKQKFELQVVNDSGTYDYSLELHYHLESGIVAVHSEYLKNDGKFLLAFDRHLEAEGEETEDGPAYYWAGRMWVHEKVDIDEIPWTISNRSILSAFDKREIPLSFVFQERIRNFYFARLSPVKMTSYTNSEIQRPEADFSNFATWYRRLVQEKPGAIFKLYQSLKEVIDGFEELTFDNNGENTRTLKIRLEIEPDEKGKKRTAKFDFQEISDGQRALIALYTLAYCSLDVNSTLVIDEPENYISLRELQPWIMLVQEQIEESGGQIILISHHPEIINILAPQNAILFRRKDRGTVTVQTFETRHYQGLTPAEIIARGWENE